MLLGSEHTADNVFSVTDSQPKQASVLCVPVDEANRAKLPESGKDSGVWADYSNGTNQGSDSLVAHTSLSVSHACFTEEDVQ